MLVRRESEILLILTTFRPEMKSLCGLIRIFAIKGAPTLSMTATATEQDVKEMRDCIGLKEEEIVVLRASPVQDHVKFQTVRRPPNGVGFDGDFSSSGSFRPGLGHLLNTIYLERFISDIRKGTEPKKAMIFFRTEMQLLATYEYLLEQLPQFDGDYKSIPFVMSHGAVGEATDKNIIERKDEIKLFLTTSKMMMGVDINDIQIVIFVRPMNQLQHFIQGAGRAGRKQATGTRQRVLVYILFNSQDLGGNVPGLEDSVRTFCTTQDCLKELMRMHFDGKPSVSSTPGWCCSSCG